MPRVAIASPYAPRVEELRQACEPVWATSVDAACRQIVARHLTYLVAALRDCFARGEAPFAAHGLYTQPGVLHDHEPADRELGMAAGQSWLAAAERLVVYTDLGVSPGMAADIAAARVLYLPVEERSLPGWGME